MKNNLLALTVVGAGVANAFAGISLGLPGAVQKQVDKLEVKVVTDARFKTTPAAVSARAGNGAVEIAWAEVPGASSYNLFWGAQSPLVKIAGVASPYLLEGLANNATIYYSATAVVRGLESNLARAATVVPSAALPVRPTWGTGIPGDRQIALAWDANTGASTFDIYWSLTPGVTSDSPRISGLSGSSYVHSGLYEATRYYYRVSARNGAGESLLSAEMSAFTNRPPVIDTLVASNRTMEIGSTVMLAAAARDPDGDAPLTYAWRCVSGALTGGGSQVTWTAPRATGRYEVSVTVTDGKGGSALRTIEMVVNNALDNSELTWVSGGAALWFAQDSTYYYGGGAAQSGRISAGQYTYLQTSVTGPVTLSFHWKVSSVSGVDYLRFYINGVPQPLSISGNVNWTQQRYTLPAGTHTLAWVYSKNSVAGSGADAGWLDNVIIARP